MPGQLPVVGDGVPGGQRLSKNRVCSGQVKGCKLLCPSCRWPGPGQSPHISGGLPLPNRHRHAPVAMVSSPTAQGYSLRPISSRAWGYNPGPNSPRVWGDMSEQGVPSLLVLHPIVGWYTCWDSTHACQHKWYPVGLSLLGCHLCPCALHPSGHRTDMFFLPHNFFKFQCPKVALQVGTLNYLFVPYLSQLTVIV